MNKSNNQIEKLFFPCFVLAMSFSMINLSVVNVGKVFGWISIGLACWISIKFMKDKLLAVLLIGVMVISRCISLRYGQYNFAYEILNGILFFICGLVLFNLYDAMLRRQMCYIVMICAPIMFLQMAGVEWVNYHTYGREFAMTHDFEDTLFIASSDLIGYRHAQIRPAGILWSNQPLGLMLAFFSSIMILHPKEGRWISCFLLNFTIVLSTSMYVYLCYLVILTGGLIFSNRVIKKRIISITGWLIVSIVALVILFPGVFHRVINKEDIRFKVYVRLFDLENAGISFEKYAFISQLKETVEAENPGHVRDLRRGSERLYTPYSLISKLYQNPIIFTVLAFAIIFIFIRYVKIFRTKYELFFAKAFSLICIVSFAAVNPYGDLSLIAFLCSFPLSPLFKRSINAWRERFSVYDSRLKRPHWLLTKGNTLKGTNVMCHTMDDRG